MHSSKLRAMKLAVLISFGCFVTVSYFLPIRAQADVEIQIEAKNPLEATQKNIALGLDHYDDHCATCHGANGKADTEKGKAVGAANLTSPETQRKSDAELFKIISEGVPGTAMPAFGKTHSATDIWHALLFVRKLPNLTPQERKQLEAAMPADAEHHSHTGEQQKEAGQQVDMSKMPQKNAQTGQAKDEHPHDMSKMGKEDNAGNMSGMSGGASMNMGDMGPLMVMNGDSVGIKIGSSSTNVMPMGQEGSGTSWQPGTSPMYMYHKMVNDWLVMFHFNLTAGVNHQGGPRGVTKAASTNWFMPMAYHKLGPGTLQLRGMLSMEPFTFAPGGTPLLFQTGETFRGQPLIDRQHPHDLFMELSATYTVPIGEHSSWFGYIGYPGEPALGPTAFMHRWSASENPDAPLAHHLEDSTHISFGVATTGFTFRGFKAEGSVFNGREPDENRYNFEAHAWNSYSGRLSYAPNQNWSLQWSYGLLRHPEVLEPGDQRRMTASVSYNKPFNRGNWASSLIWGRTHNYGGGFTANLNGYTAESTLNFLDRNYIYTRMELVDKNELLRPADRLKLGITNDHPSFRIGAYTFGGDRDIVDSHKLLLAVGGQVTFYSMPSILNPIYGTHPTSFEIFFRLRPSKMIMHDQGGQPSGSDHKHDHH